MIPGRGWVRCEAFGRAQQSFGQTTCHRTTLGDPTVITATHTPALPQSFEPKRSSLHFRILLPRLSMGAEIPVCPLCHTPRMPRRQGDAWGCQNYPTCAAPTTTTPSGATESQDAAAEAADPSRHLLVKPWANGTGKEIRVSCAGPSSATRARSLEPASRSRGNW